MQLKEFGPGGGTHPSPTPSRSAYANVMFTLRLKAVVFTSFKMGSIALNECVHT